MGTSGEAMQGRPVYRLFDSKTVAVAAFICSPLAGVFLIAANFVRLGKSGKAAVAVVFGMMATAVPVLIQWNWRTLAGSVCSIAIGLLLFLCTWQIAYEVQGEAVEEHVARGGRLGRGWVAFVVGVASIAGVYAVASGIAYEVGHRDMVRFGKDRVVYSGLATKGTAEALGEALQARKLLRGNGERVAIEKGVGGTTVSYTVEEGAWNQAGVAAMYEEATRAAAPAVGGLPVEIKLVDERGEEQATLAVGEVEVENGGKVIYEGKASKEEAEGLGGQLEGLGYFKTEGATVFLIRHDDEGTVVAFVVKDAAEVGAKRVAELEQMVRDVAPMVGGLPVVMRIEDEQLVVKVDDLMEP